MAYAENTTVSVEKSIAGIISLVKRAGAQRVAQFDEPEQFTITFELANRMIRFQVALPPLGEMPVRDGRGVTLPPARRAEKRQQAHRQKARALLLVIKAKLESVESEVETFEQAFLPNVVMADGATVYERIAAPIAAEYERGAPGVLLLSGPGGR
ncbi:hypothetical protein GGQ80_002041 [Sphingomonas jinjuensis]|uniref:Uncharacterized protein n=1 Tax=Sphingomonas jinjuensis TaxID=535907 RepID=A0A840FBR5_9SPHN|nr:hypothetical protein [Sphingomonas jinjuensis]MBB4154131.1 hypothetical protein [Sphingomonas jinjuensis]